MKIDAKKTVKYIAFFLFCGLLGFGFARLFGSFAEDLFGSDIRENVTIPKWQRFALSIFIMYMVIVIHELGHLLTGLFQGFRFQLFVAGFLGIRREDDDSIKMYFNTDFNYFGGVAATSPTQEHPDNARKFGNLLLAGPLASLGFALLCFFLMTVADPNWRMICFIGSLGSFAIFLATTIPSKTGQFYTDRKRYQRLVQPGKAREIELALIDVQGKMASKDGLARLDVDKLRLIQEDEAPFFRYIGYFYELAYSHKFDTDKIPSIKEEMSALEKDIPKTIPALFEKELEKMLAK